MSSPHDHDGVSLLDPAYAAVMGELPAFHLPVTEKILTGSMYGSTRPRVDFTKFIELYKAKRLKLDELVTTTYTLDQVNQGYQDLLDGKNVRGVIVYGSS